MMSRRASLRSRLHPHLRNHSQKSLPLQLALARVTHQTLNPFYEDQILSGPKEDHSMLKRVVKYYH